METPSAQQTNNMTLKIFKANGCKTEYKYLDENLLHWALPFRVTHVSIFLNMLRSHGS